MYWLNKFAAHYDDVHKDLKATELTKDEITWVKS